MQPDLVAEFTREYHAEINRLRREHDLQREAKKREFLDVTRKLDGLIDAIADGLRGPRVAEQMQALESRREQLGCMAAASAQPMPIIHPNLSALYRRKVDELHQSLSDPTMRDEALSLVRSLIERIAVQPMAGGFEIELVGDIANMVAVSANLMPDNKKAAPDRAAVLDRFRSSVKVVAGAGFEPATFRL